MTSPSHISANLKYHVFAMSKRCRDCVFGMTSNSRIWLVTSHFVTNLFNSPIDTLNAISMQSSALLHAKTTRLRTLYVQQLYYRLTKEMSDTPCPGYRHLRIVSVTIDQPSDSMSVSDGRDPLLLVVANLVGVVGLQLLWTECRLVHVHVYDDTSCEVFACCCWLIRSSNYVMEVTFPPMKSLLRQQDHQAV